jgi:hypothetical protein
MTFRSERFRGAAADWPGDIPRQANPAIVELRGLIT